MAIIAKQNTANTFKPYTGYCAFDVLAFNPTNEEYKAITGRDIYDLSYDANDDGVITHRVLVREVVHNTYHFAQFRIGNTPWESTKNPGSFQWVDKNLNFGWGTSPDEVKSSGFDAKSAKKAVKGLEDFGMFIKRVLRVSKDVDVSSVMSSLEDIDIADVIKLKKKAVNNLIREASLADAKGVEVYPFAAIATALTVKVADNGKMYQQVSTHKDVMTTAELNKDNQLVPSEFWVNKVREKIEKSQATQYPIIPSSHIFGGMEIKEVDLSASSDDDMPF